MGAECRQKRVMGEGKKEEELEHLCVCVCPGTARPVIFDVEPDSRPMGDLVDLGDCSSLGAQAGPNLYSLLHTLCCRLCSIRVSSRL